MKEGGDREGHKMYKHDWAKHVHTGVLHQANNPVRVTGGIFVVRK